MLEENKKDFVFTGLNEILPKVETLIESTKKRYTLFYFISYEKGERKIKIEISKRQGKSSFIVRSYLGIPILLMAKKDLETVKVIVANDEGASIWLVRGEWRRQFT